METIYSLLKKSCPNASDEEIIDAADRAHVIDFAWELRHGLNTVVGPQDFLFTPLQQQLMEHAVRILQDRRLTPEKWTAGKEVQA